MARKNARSMAWTKKQDYEVYKRQTGVSPGVRAQFFQLPIVDLRRESDADFEVVVLTFEHGGQLRIHTQKPLMWVEPERM